MGMIPLKEYAERLGKNRVVALQRNARGCFKTTKKIGCQWFIDEDEPWVDGRVKSGEYIGFHEGYQNWKEIQRKRKETSEE